ncbi:MAG: putative DNA binding domain-containing protein [Hydrogenophaga sp.]|jgi:ATP-dependent DNA helicase RecG|nr:putative DNA binding domain-containing protein [Hydrogenophaga sp.]
MNMSLEDHQTDCKLLRTVSGKTADWTALAQDTVCFANGAGGRLLIGIEDGQALPPPDQRVEPELLDRLRKRIGELTVNVQALPRLQCAANGGEFIELLIDRSPGVATARRAWPPRATAATFSVSAIAVSLCWATTCCASPMSGRAGRGRR